MEKAGVVRGVPTLWPNGLPLAPAFAKAWRAAWDENPELHVLPLMHPSGQNMSPYARVETAFHARMVETRDALRDAVTKQFGWTLPGERAELPTEGIYALPEWTDRIAPRHQDLDARWRAKGI
jgi:hypothetical protein